MALTRPNLRSLGMHSQLVGRCLCLVAVLWLRGFWASASVIKVTAVWTLRWLPTLGLLSLIFLIFFMAVLSGLRLARKVVVCSPEPSSVSRVQRLSCTLVVSTLHHLSLHRRVGMLWATPMGLGCSEVGSVACGAPADPSFSRGSRGW